MAGGYGSALSAHGADTLHRYPAEGLPFRVINNYGATVCTAVATSGEIKPHDSQTRPSVGSLVANTSIYALDENRAPVEPGAVGEIYIGGAGVARGYRNRPHLTAENFFDNPFTLAQGARMFRTGDLGCVLPDGRIAFRGRIDRQEKIRGFRVQLDEIAAVLNTFPSVESSAVVAKREANDKRLVAYVVSSTPVDSGAMRDFLGARLPGFMVPSAFLRHFWSALTVDPTKVRSRMKSRKNPAIPGGLSLSPACQRGGGGPTVLERAGHQSY